MGYVGAFGASLHLESKKRTLEAAGGPLELRVHEVESTTSLQHGGLPKESPAEEWVHLGKPETQKALVGLSRPRPQVVLSVQQDSPPDRSTRQPAPR